MILSQWNGTGRQGKRTVLGAKKKSFQAREIAKDLLVLGAWVGFLCSSFDVCLTAEVTPKLDTPPGSDISVPGHPLQRVATSDFSVYLVDFEGQSLILCVLPWGEAYLEKKKMEVQDSFSTGRAALWHKSLFLGGLGLKQCFAFC